MSQNKPQIVDVKIQNKNFEILCKKDMPIKFRENQQMSIQNVILSDTIYSDSQKGEVASQADIQQYLSVEANKFNQDLITYILLHGHIELSTEERRKRTEQKMIGVIGYIHENFVDMDKKIIPIERIKQAIAQIKGLSIDPLDDVQRIAQDIMKKLEKNDILRFQQGGVEFKIIVDYKYQGKVENMLNKEHIKHSMDYDTQLTFKCVANDVSYNNILRELEKELQGHYDMKSSGQGHTEPQVEQKSNDKKGKKGKKGK